MKDLRPFDSLIVEHLNRRAGEAVPLAQLDAITASDWTARVVPIDGRGPSGRGRLLVAAAALAALGIGALAVVGRDDARPAATADVEPTEPATPVQPFVATVGNYVPSRSVDSALQVQVAEARFDSEDTSYARMTGLPDLASSTPDQLRTVVTSVWRSMSIITSPPPVAVTETPADLDGIRVTIQTDAAGSHHLVEATRPDGDEVRIEGTAISLPAFIAVVEDLVYADPQSFSTQVDEMNAPGVIEVPIGTSPVDPMQPIDVPMATQLPAPGVEIVGTAPPFATDEAGVTVPAGVRTEGNDLPAATTPLPSDEPPPATDPVIPEPGVVFPDVGDPGLVDADDTQASEGVGGSAMLIVDTPSEWTMSSASVGDVDQSTWQRGGGGGPRAVVTYAPASLPVDTFVPDTFGDEVAVFAGGVFVYDPDENGLPVRSDATGTRHEIEVYTSRDDSEVLIRVTMSFRQSSLDDVVGFLSALRPVDRTEWERIAADG